MSIIEYLAEHLIARIGADLPEQICSEVIVDNPKEFIHFLFQHDCYVSAIMWWERVSIESTPQIGYGGVPDPRNPSRFYFSETDIWRQFNKSTGVEEYYSYLCEVYCEYSHLELFPAFEVCKKSADY